MNKLFKVVTDNTNALPQSGAASKPYSKVIIKDLVVDMFIGIYDTEKQNTQRVIINIDVFTAHKNSWDGDDYGDVVCYETIVNKVKDMAASGHIHLVETFAHKIADYCLENEATEQVIVRVEKPDIMTETTAVGFEIKKIK